MQRIINKNLVTLLCGCLLSDLFGRTMSQDAPDVRNVQYQSLPTVNGLVRDVQVDSSGDFYFSALLSGDVINPTTAFVTKFSSRLEMLWKQDLSTRGQPLAAPSLTVSPDGRIYALQTSSASLDSGNVSILELYQLDASTGELTPLLNTSVFGLVAGTAGVCLHSRYSSDILYVGIHSKSKTFPDATTSQAVSKLAVWKLNVTGSTSAYVWKLITTPRNFLALSFAFDENVSDGSLCVIEIVSPVDDTPTKRLMQVSSISPSDFGISQAMIPASSSSSWISAAAVDAFGSIIVSEGPGMLHHLTLITPPGPSSSLQPSNITIDWTLSSTDQVSSLDVARKASPSFPWIYAVGMARGVLGANVQNLGTNYGEPNEVPFVAIYNATGRIVFREVLTPTPGTNETLTSVHITSLSSGNAMVAGFSEQTGLWSTPHLLLLRYQLPSSFRQAQNSTTSPTPRPITIRTPSPLPASQSKNSVFAVALIASVSTALLVIALLSAFVMLSFRRTRHVEDSHEATLDRDMADSSAANALARETFS